LFFSLSYACIQFRSFAREDADVKEKRSGIPAFAGMTASGGR